MKLAPKLAKTLLKLLAACLLIVLMFRWFEHSQVYHPDRVMAATGAELGRPFKEVRFKAGSLAPAELVSLAGDFFDENGALKEGRSARMRRTERPI